MRFQLVMAMYNPQIRERTVLGQAHLPCHPMVEMASNGDNNQLLKTFDIRQVKFPVSDFSNLFVIPSHLGCDSPCNGKVPFIRLSVKSSIVTEQFLSDFGTTKAD